MSMWGAVLACLLGISFAVSRLWIIPNSSTWSIDMLVAIHISPALAVWAACFLMWQRNKRRNGQRQAEREKRIEAQREADIAAARAKHDEEMRHRYFACECRAIAITGLMAESAEGIVGADAENVLVSLWDTNKPAPLNLRTNALDGPVAEALRHIYTSCAAAAAFPLYVAPAANMRGVEIVEGLRRLNMELIEELALPLNRGDTAVLFLPQSDSAFNAVISLFETMPDLPGAVVLGFDAPASAVLRSEDVVADVADNEPPEFKRVGKPSQGVFALLLTNPQLDTLLEGREGQESSENADASLTPYWQKPRSFSGHMAPMKRVPVASREQLRALPRLGSIHRAVSIQSNRGDRQMLQLARDVQGLLERAQLNANLIQQPFVGSNDEQNAVTDMQREKPGCGWLVHNAGSADCAGPRLAAVGAALNHFEMDLNPIDMATNVVTRIGNLGRTRQVAMLALSAANAAAAKAAVLCVEFNEPDGIAAAFVVAAS